MLSFAKNGWDLIYSRDIAIDLDTSVLLDNTPIVKFMHTKLYPDSITCKPQRSILTDSLHRLADVHTAALYRLDPSILDSGVRKLVTDRL